MKIEKDFDSLPQVIKDKLNKEETQRELELSVAQKAYWAGYDAALVTAEDMIEDLRYEASHLEFSPDYLLSNIIDQLKDLRKGTQ